MSKLKAETKPLAGPLAEGRPAGATTVSRATARRRGPVAPRVLREQGRAACDGADARHRDPRSKSRWWLVPVPVFLITHPTAGRFSSTPASTPRSRRSRPPTSAGSPPGSRGRGSSPAATSPRSCASAASTRAELGPCPHPPPLRPQRPESPSTRSATFVLSRREWEAATTDHRPILRGYRPSHFDYLFDYRTVDFDGPTIASYASFGRTFDLFGDGSVRLAFTPGHSAGHCSVIARLSDRDFVIAGDAIYTHAQLEGGDPPPRPVDMHNWTPLAAGAAAVRAHLPAGGDPPRARRRPLADAREALRVARRRAVSAGSSRTRLMTAARPSRSSSSYISRTWEKISCAHSSCCSRDGDSTTGS